MSLEIIVLAAGKGTRMRSSRPKVLHELAGEPLLVHALRAVRRLKPRAIHVVNGHGAEEICERLSDPDIRWVSQPEQLGTANAVQQAMPGINPEATVLVTYGDVPLVSSDVLAELAQGVETAGISLLIARVEDPAGYGRIVRDGNNQIVQIVEHKDADSAQLQIQEINTGFIATHAGDLNRWLEQVENSNSQGEYYLTDVIEIAVREGVRVKGHTTTELHSVLGVNTKYELAELEHYYRARRAREFLDQGVTIVDPKRFDARGEIQFGADCVVDVNVILEGPITIGNGVHIGPNNVIRRATIGDRVKIQPQCVIEDAEIGMESMLGPFTRIRPGTKLADRVHIGNFVEVKNSDLASGAKANHLSYVGDSSVGRDVNIGAGVITCNYDGVNKHRTDIEDDVFVGSNTQLVAPVRIGKGATVAAGSTITTDVPPDTLAIARGRQRHVENWEKPRKKERS